MASESDNEIVIASGDVVDGSESKDEVDAEYATESVAARITESRIGPDREAEKAVVAEDNVVEKSVAEAEEKSGAESFLEVMTKEDIAPDNVGEESATDNGVARKMGWGVRSEK